MTRFVTLLTFILLIAGFIVTQVTHPTLQTHTLIDGSPCLWNLHCGMEPLSAAALAGRAGILIGMLLVTVAGLHFGLKRLAKATR